MASQQPLSCPRCESLNTKFCYYNNYNLSQPRHFCKACRRYWTHGGSLRSIPVGGGSRKHPKRSPYSSAAVPASHASSSGASSPTQVAVVADQIAGRQGQKQRQDEDEDRVWSDVNVNEANCSFSSLLGVNTDRLNGYGFGLLPGFDEFGLGGPSADLVNGVSDTWHSVPGRAEIMDCFGWPDLSISVPSNDSLD